MLNTTKIREDFPILQRKINGKPLVYLDNAATTQKPIQVIDAVSDFYKNHNANIFRGMHTLSQEASRMYEDAHDKIAGFINSKPNELVITKNATEAANLVAYSYGIANLNEGDEILLTRMEHHSNLLPWQELRDLLGLKLKFIDIKTEGELKYVLDTDNLNNLFTKKTKLVALTHVSNVLGCINPVKEIAKLAHDNNAVILVDGCQSIPHMPVDVKELGCDFFAFSAHKMLGPTGVGGVYAKESILREMKPFLTGGSMVGKVGYEKSTHADIPFKFEAGTPNVAGVIGTGKAIEYLEKLDMEEVRRHEKLLSKLCLEKLNELKKVKLYASNPEYMAGVVSFSVEEMNPHDVAKFLDEAGIAVRSGMHCAQPLVTELHPKGTARASFYVYNTAEEVEKLAEELKKL